MTYYTLTEEDRQQAIHRDAIFKAEREDRTAAYIEPDSLRDRIRELFKRS